MTSKTRNIKITIEYDGTDYVGWQRQENGPSVQARIEEAIRSLVHEVPGLTDRNIESATDYVEEFYLLIRDPERAARDLKRMCKRG